MTKAALLDELGRLSSRERLELAYSLLDSVLHEQSAPPLGEAHRRELQERLAYHRAHPNEPGVTLEEIRRKLTS